MTSIDPTRPAGITLAKGAHDNPDDGLCYMEWIAYTTGEPHTDRPQCVSPVLCEMGRQLNDTLPDNLRQTLLVTPGTAPVGTAGDGHDETRGYLALDWLIREWLPTWLDLAPACRDVAARLRELGRIVDLASAECAGPIVRQAQTAADVAWDAGSAAGAAARDAARATAGAAAGDAAWDVAWDAGVAAWVAARDAGVAAAGAAAGAAWDAWDAARDAWDAARDVRVAAWAAWAAARDAAWVAAWDAGVAAAGAAWDARDAGGAGGALQSTVERLQLSVIDLYARMAHVGRDTPERAQ